MRAESQTHRSATRGTEHGERRAKSSTLAAEGRDSPGRWGKRPYDDPALPPGRSLVILRKEVIQPQVLLRLPCYDLVPIIELTFGVFLPCGLDQRLRVLPTLVA